jgi:aspartokinase/homoserine dehydrogenase 1
MSTRSEESHPGARLDRVPPEELASQPAVRVDLLLLGKGTVGGQLLEHLATGQGSLRQRHGREVRLVGLADRRASLFDPDGIDPRTARERLGASREPSDLQALLGRVAPQVSPVLVDCTAADGMEAIYEQAFARGLHVVTANKKPLAATTARRERLLGAALRARRALRYETTVGASLPVIESLKDLIRTGDRVHLIEGSFSGTLGFLASEVSRGARLSQAVREARERGYTEPHPRDDLSGADVARKALILARELGATLDVEQIEVTPFVPADLLAHDEVEAFLGALEAHDGPFEALLRARAAEGLRLRYLAQITPGAPGKRPAVRVGPTFVPEDHPAASLRGAEAFVAFHSERYLDYPLVVRGPGAGGALTAAGLLADILALVPLVGGR